MPVLFEMGQSRPSNDAAHTMANEIDDDIFLLVLLHIIADVTLYFIGYLFAHGSDIAFSVVLVRFGDEEIGVGDLLQDPTLNEVHIVGRALEAVAEDDEHMPLGVLKLAALNRDLLFGLGNGQKGLFFMTFERKNDLIKHNGLFLLLLLIFNILNRIIIETNIFPSDFLCNFFIFL